jgi:hypothetical protein
MNKTSCAKRTPIVHVCACNSVGWRAQQNAYIASAAGGGDEENRLQPPNYLREQLLNKEQL